MAGPRRAERPRTRRAQLHEASHRRDIRKPVSPATRAPTGRRRLRWFRVSKWRMSGTHRSSPARFSTACCGSASCTISRSSGTRAARCSRRTHYWFQHEPCWYVRKKNAPWYGKAGENSTIWDSPSPKFIMGGSDEEKFDHPTQKPVELMRRPILNHTKPGELVYDPFLGSGTTLAAAEADRARLLRPGTRSEVCRRRGRALAGADREASHARRRRPHV